MSAVLPNLFAERAPLDWLPGETLFSYCARYHILSANHLASTTCKQLFGDPHQGSAHDFPSRIADFCARTHDQLGSAEEIVRQRTQLPFYLPFIDADTAQTAISALTGPSIGSLKYQLGLTASRFRANHPLKACTACQAEDIEKYGVAYWHLDHQWLGVVICTKHLQFLRYSDLKATGVRRFHWVLPNVRHLSGEFGIWPVPPLVTLLAEAAIRLAHLPAETHFEPRKVREAFRSEIMARGLMRGEAGHSLNAEKVGQLFSEFLVPLSKFPELAGLPFSSRSAYHEVASLTSAVCSHRHPIRYLALICWLFRDLDAFMERYNQTSGEAEGAMQDEEQFSSEIKDPRKEVFIEKLHEGQSVSAAARAIGIAVSTGEVWALAASIRVNKRPSLILGETKKRMMAALKRGASKEKVAEIGGVSISSVTRLLRTESGLQSAWHQAQVETRRQTARRAWQRIVSRNPRAGVKALRLLEPAEYAWLYRNDRAWLDRQIESQPCAPNQGGMPVDWVSRDAALAHQVEKTGLQLAEQFPGKRIKLWQLYQAVPDLKAKLERMDRLPQTHAVIQRMCRTRNENGTKTFALPGC